MPIVGNVAAGSPILAQECIEDYLTFDTGGRDGEYFALRVRGESMLNAGILPGDLVVVRQQQTCNQGEIVVAMIDDEATVKRFSRKNGHIWLLPENDDYEPIDGTYAQILGKVVAWCGSTELRPPGPVHSPRFGLDAVQLQKLFHRNKPIPLRLQRVHDLKRRLHGGGVDVMQQDDVAGLYVL